MNSEYKFMSLLNEVQVQGSYEWHSHCSRSAHFWFLVPISLTVLHCDSNSMQILFYSHLDSKKVIFIYLLHMTCAGMARTKLL